MGNANAPLTKITLAPIADSGFNANRRPFFCKTFAVSPLSHLLPGPAPPGTDPVNTKNPQGVFPNQLLSALIRGNRLYLPNIGAQPEPPETASTNVQALVNPVDTKPRPKWGPDSDRNLNKQIAVETAAPPRVSTGRLATTLWHRCQPGRRQIPDRQPRRQPGVARQTR